MTRQKKIYTGLAGFAGFLLISLLVLHYQGSTFLNSERMRKKVQTIISQKTGGNVEYKSVDLSIFPITHAVIHQASISLPGKGTGNTKTLTIQPRILPLFIGKFRINEILVESPDIEMVMPRRVMPRSSEQSNETKEPFNLDTFKDTVIGMLSPLAAELPEFHVTIKDGGFNLVDEDETFFTLSDVQAEIGCLSKEIEIKINGTSNICKDISMIARFDQKDMKGKGEVELKHIQPQTLINRFLPDAAFRITEPIDKVSVDLKIDGPNDLQVGLKSSLPYLELHMGDKQSVIKCKNLEGYLHLEEGKTAVSLTELDLDQPQLNIMGELVVDHEKQQKSVELTGRDIDVNSIREEVLNFLGENKVVKILFQVMKGGTMPHLAFTSQGRTFADLTKLENLVVHANLREGNVFIPGPDFDLEEVSGDVALEQGILKGTHIDARLGDAYGQEGNLSMGLKGKDAPIHVETSITADAEQIPPLLKRLIGNETFLSEIKRVVDLKGVVKGKLVLGERLDAIDVEVDLDKINVSANHDVAPFPLQINDGSFHYDKENISMTNLGGGVGNSSFSELTARISLGEDARVEILSGRVMAVLKEIYPWLSSFDKDKNLKDVKTVSGTLQVSSLKLQGLLTMPETFKIEATGDVNDLTVDTTLFPEPIVVKEGNIKVVGKQVIVSDAKVNAGDLSLITSVTINHNMSEFVKADIGFHGEMGKESMKWIEDRFKLPPALSIRPPLSIPEAHLTWEKDSGISFVSNLSLQDGLGISLDMFMGPESLVINNFLIQDAEDKASFTFSLKKKEIDFNFTGNLSHTTTDKIFLNTPLSKEWIKGDFHEHIQLDQLEHSTFQGILEGGNLSLPWKQKIPFNIKNISLRADNKSVRVDSLILTWQDSHLSVNGDINISENGFLFDLAMSADRLDWETIRKTLNIGDKEQDKSAGEEKHFWDFPVKGILRLDAESFTFDKYTWDPVKADISFDPDCISVQVIDANVCGISCPGVLKVTPQDISLDFQLLIHNQKLSTPIKCFGSTEGLITGEIDFEAHIMARGTSEELDKSLNGNFEITARDGKYNGFGLISKILSFLNPTEIFKGKLSGLTKKGFPYKSFTANGQIQNGILTIDKYALDAPSMGVHGYGTYDLFAKKIDVELLVSPFNTTDSVIKKIPVVRGVLGGTIVSIPIQVKGDIENPKISYLSPSAVGKRLLNTTKRILKTPVNLIKRKKKNDKNSVK
jgi:hypothetical protein